MTAQEILDEPWEMPEYMKTGAPVPVQYVCIDDQLEPNKHLHRTLQETPLEDVIQEFEQAKEPFSLTKLFLAGYRYKDEAKWGDYKSPYDTD